MAHVWLSFDPLQTIDLFCFPTSSCNGANFLFFLLHKGFWLTHFATDMALFFGLSWSDFLRILLWVVTGLKMSYFLPSVRLYFLGGNCIYFELFRRYFNLISTYCDRILACADLTSSEFFFFFIVLKGLHIFTTTAAASGVIAPTFPKTQV